MLLFLKDLFKETESKTLLTFQVLWRKLLINFSIFNNKNLKKTWTKRVVKKKVTTNKNKRKHERKRKSSASEKNLLILTNNKVLKSIKVLTSWRVSMTRMY